MAGYYQQPYPQFYQPQNIYQQLGQPQPQPHLQAHPTYVTQPQQQQQVPQAPGYSYPQQPTYPQPSPTPTIRRVPSYVPPYNQYQLPAQPPQQPPPSQVFAPAQPVYSSYSQPHVPQIPQSSISVPRNGNFTQIPRPPIAPSANLAQQAQAAQAQVQAQPPPGRRPLPKPSPTARTPALPPSNPLPISTRPRATTESGPARPFPQPIATSLSSQSTTSVPSPTRSRPLPTPTVANKRSTVDLGKPTNFAPIPVAQSSSSSTLRRAPSPVKAPLPAPTNDATPTRLSRTTSFATMNATDATTKRRTSPPTFRSQPSSVSSSPTKTNPPPMKWTSSNSTTPNSRPTTFPVSTSAESSSPPKKFTPIWKRTIPDYPAPVFGYAAGMVSEPHPKPAQPAAQATPTKANPQGKGKSPEKGKEAKSLLPYLQDSPGQSQPPPQQFSYRQPAVPQPPPPPPQQRMSGWHGRAPATAQQEETTEDDDSDDSDSDEDEDDDDDDDEEETDPESAYQYEGSDYNSEDTSGRGSKARDPPRNGRLRTESRKEPSRKKGTVQVAKPKKKKKRPAPEDKRLARALQDRQWEREQQRSYGEYDDRDRTREPPSDRDQRRYTYTEDREEVRRPAYRHERSYSERDRRLEYDDELDAPRRRSPTKSSPSRDLDWPQDRRRDGPSPQWGIRNMPQRRSGPGRRYSDEEEEEEYNDDEDNHYRREEQRRAKDFRERGWNDDPSPRHGRGTGLPRPPPMVRDVGGREGDAIRRKVKKVPLRDFDDEEDERNMALRFASFKVSNGDRSPNSSNGGGGNWPTNLPRLPRTPGGGTPGAGSAHSGGEGGYFDPRPNGASTSAAASSSGSAFRGRTVIRPRENLRNIDLDDSPPRPSSTILRSPSPAASASSSAFSQRRALPQPQGQPYDGPLSSAGEQLQRRRSLYSMPSKQQQQPEPSVRERRPQSQMYASSSNVDHSYSEQSRQRHDIQPSFNMQSKPPQIFGPHPTRIQPQTPAPPRSVNIESPAPIGGRERMADIPRIEQGGEDHHGKRHGLPTINVDSLSRISTAPPSIPMINIDSGSNNNSGPPQINISGPQINVEPAESRRKEAPPRVQVYDVPGVSVSGPEFDDGPNIKVSGPNDDGPRFRGQQQQQRPQSQSQSQFGGGTPSRRGGLICDGCNGPIIGRIVSAMGSRWHPQCFRCTVCEELLEHVSSYEHDGRPYCHLDYHENFAPKCYSCKTAIIEEQFISLDDPALGKRTYHTQHFFCAECGDPFLSPSISADNKGELALSGDGDFEGFTVFRGHPYCEPCHVRLRLPKCKRCKRSIRDNDQAVEALGGKWCWSCFVCDSCSKPFEDPSFFQRDDRPYCERCFSILLRNEI